MDLGSERQLLAKAEAILPTVLREVYASRLHDDGVSEEGDRRFFTLTDTAGRRIELRLDTAALPQPLVARTFTNTTTDRYVVQLADTLRPDQVGQVLSREVGELLAVRDRAVVGGRAPLDSLLAPSAQLPAYPQLSEADRGRADEFNYLATRMNNTGLGARERQDARDRFSALVDESGLRPGVPAADEERHTVERYEANIRQDIVRPLLSASARTAMVELARPLEQLEAADAQALARERSAQATQMNAAPESAFPLPGLRTDGTPVPREELDQAVTAAAEQRTALSNRTLEELRARQAELPPGRHPQYEIMIGGGAALAGRDPGMLLVDGRGRWHVDPIEAIVQSADQVRHIRQSGMGDPYQFADPRQRVPLPALQLWEDTAAARGPLIDGRAELSTSAGGRLIAQITPADGSAPVTIEVQGSPLIATGIPPEIIPGANRQVPTVTEATDVLAERLTAIATPEATEARNRLLALPASEGRAAAALDVLSGPGITDALSASEDSRVTGATETLRASAAWDQARAAAPGRVLMGDEIGDGDYDPSVATDWVIAGVGGAAIANAEIIMQARPDTRVFMVGKEAPFVLHNDAQYTQLRRKHDAEYGGDGRLVTLSGHYLGAVGTTTTSDGRVRLAALDSAGAPLGIEGDAYVACLGRVSRLPQALDPLESWTRSSGGQIRGELVFDSDRQYLGYRLDLEANGQRHNIDVTGAASRMLPGNVFSREDMARLAVVDAKTVPPESGNVAAGFMATALQGSQLARQRSAARNPGGATPYSSAAQQREGARQVAEAFVDWSRSEMGQQVISSRNQTVSAFREAWKALTATEASALQYREVARTSAAVVEAAASSGRFKPEEVAALNAVSDRAHQHTARLVATHGPPTAPAKAAPPTQRVTSQIAPPPPGISGRGRGQGV